MTKFENPAQGAIPAGCSVVWVAAMMALADQLEAAGLPVRLPDGVTSFVAKGWRFTANNSAQDGGVIPAYGVKVEKIENPLIFGLLHPSGGFMAQMSEEQLLADLTAMMTTKSAASFAAML